MARLKSIVKLYKEKKMEYNIEELASMSRKQLLHLKYEMLGKQKKTILQKHVDGKNQCGRCHKQFISKNRLIRHQIKQHKQHFTKEYLQKMHFNFNTENYHNSGINDE